MLPPNPRMNTLAVSYDSHGVSMIGVTADQRLLFGGIGV